VIHRALPIGQPNKFVRGKLLQIIFVLIASVFFFLVENFFSYFLSMTVAQD
jgi:hypothetical protein